jgi:hypothetical protein
MAFDGHLRAMLEGAPDVFKAGFHEYVEEIGEYRDIGRADPGSNEIDGMYLRTVANNMIVFRGDRAHLDWREGVNAAMWLLLGAYLRDLPPLPERPGT